MSTPAYQTIIVKFREAITELDGIFRDMQFWGVATLKEWIDDYEGSRFTAIDPHTAVITSEYKYGVSVGMAETPYTHCRDNRMLNKLAVRTPPTINTKNRYDSKDHF